jgi:endonuclease YncB( thermonuclease family)
MSRGLKLLNAGARLFSRRLWSTLVLLLLISACQTSEQGKPNWYQTVHAEFSDYRDQLVRDWNRPDQAPPTPLAGQQLSGKVVRVTDGDTFILLTSDEYEYTIRLYGIDAPEYDQPYGIMASQALTDMIADRDVAVTIMDTDNYGRQVGQVYHQGIDINLGMVKNGHAWWYKQYARSNHGLAQAETQAREAGAGLWTGTRPVPPWLWRRKR